MSLKNEPASEPLLISVEFLKRSRLDHLRNKDQSLYRQYTGVQVSCTRFRVWGLGFRVQG